MQHSPTHRSKTAKYQDDITSASHRQNVTVIQLLISRIRILDISYLESMLIPLVIMINISSVARQHPSYGDCLEVMGVYCQSCSVLGCVTQCSHSQQHTHMSSSYRSSRLRLSHWDPHAMHIGGCLELYYCNMVEWS